MSSTPLEKIKKLLRLANDSGATSGEVNAALGRAAALAARYNISQVEIERATRADGTEGVKLNVDPKSMVVETIYERCALNRWHKRIAVAVERATCTGTYVSFSKGKPCIVCYGLPQDVAVAREIFAFANTARRRLTREWARKHNLRENHRDARSFADGFCYGLLEAAEPKDEEKVRMPVDGGTTALVTMTSIVEAKRSALQTKYSQLGLRTGRRSKMDVGGGFGAGREAGRKTSLRRDVVN